ncbi:CoA ester lyase [Marinobacter sp.]|uniref:HpcH/HpaI aldolase/citrate lyase family protein n=1 Tax=Marinobacter sp. TaxID=50741 RepID=UPI003561A943
MTEDYLRSFLFVPATRPDRIAKALASGADTIIVDLEDAVPLEAKDSARASLAEYLKTNPDALVMVRINGADSAQYQADIALCKNAANITGVMLPKAADRSDIEYVSEATGKPVWPLIESAAGIASLPTLVKASGIARLSIGALDLASDLSLASNTPGAETVLDYCKCQLVIHSRAAGLAAPVETVVPVIDNPEYISKVATKANEMGFRGMLAIHPRQLPEIHQAFTPDPEQVLWAERVLEGADQFGAVFQLDGKMIDAPVIQEAKSILARADLT